jgi:hypothetical protein
MGDHDVLFGEDRERFVRVARVGERFSQENATGMPVLLGSRARATVNATATPSAFMPVTTPRKPGHATLANGIAPSSCTMKTTFSRSKTSAASKSNARAKSACPSAVRSGPITNAVHPRSGECSNPSAMSYSAWSIVMPLVRRQLRARRGRDESRALRQRPRGDGPRGSCGRQP